MWIAALLALALLAHGGAALGAHDPGPCGSALHPAGPPQPAPATRKRVALALGSGSMHGLAHIGVLQELEALGLEVKIVAGTSVGAIIGGLWASGYSGDEIEVLSQGSHWEDSGRFAASWQGLFSNDGLKAQLTKLFGGRAIESWPRRFVAVATNVSTGNRRLLTRGDGAAAIQASSAVPVVFMPVTMDSERLVDGALVEPVPVGAARALGADFVIAVDVAYRPYEEEASGITGLAFQAMHILINALSVEQVRGADVALRLDLHHRLMTCGSRALIQAGRDAIRAAWPDLVAKLR